MATTTSVGVPQATGPRRLTLRNYLAYAAGDAANNLSFTMAGMFLILYYTNVVGVEGAVIGTMFLAVRFIDALTDLVAGRLVDMKKVGKMGKFRPFILWFSLPLLLTSMAIYSAKTFFPDISGTAAVVYMYGTYILMGSIFYTLVNIPYGSMAPSITQAPDERGKLAAFRGYGAAVAVLALAFIIAPSPLWFVWYWLRWRSRGSATCCSRWPVGSTPTSCSWPASVASWWPRCSTSWPSPGLFGRPPRHDRRRGRWSTCSTASRWSSCSAPTSVSSSCRWPSTPPPSARWASSRPG